MTALPYAERQFLTQDGLSLYYRDYDSGTGAGATLLCLAGLTRNSADFAELAEAHAGERRIVCLDYRGRGRSDRAGDWRTYTPETYVNDIRHLIVATGLHGFVPVGTSLGGFLSMVLGAVMPSAIAGVVLNDVGPQIETMSARRSNPPRQLKLPTMPGRIGLCPTGPRRLPPSGNASRNSRPGMTQPSKLPPARITAKAATVCSTTTGTSIW